MAMDETQPMRMWKPTRMVKVVSHDRKIHEGAEQVNSMKQEREMLKMLVHLVGDIHQPLHVGRQREIKAAMM